MRARTVGELAAQHGVPLEDLVRTPLYGMLAPDAPFFCTFRWDMHHEHPVTTAEDLAGRELLSYDGWSIDDDKPEVGLDAVASLRPATRSSSTRRCPRSSSRRCCA